MGEGAGAVAVDVAVNGIAHESIVKPMAQFDGTDKLVRPKPLPEK